MTTTEIEVAAANGNPYTISRDHVGLIRLARVTRHGRPITLVFNAEDATAVADALVDLAEGVR